MRVRMAPSPTGPLHIGTARTSLYNYLVARHEGGTYVLRIEDTDAARGTDEFERDIIDNLHWLGISWDEGPQVAGGEDIGPHAPYRQSARMELYAREANRLLEAGSAYRCWCTPEELEAVRKQQEAAKQPPKYNRRCLNLTDAERAAFEAEGRRSVIRFKVSPEVDPLRRPRARRGRVRQRAARRLRHRAQRRGAALPLRGRGRRRGRWRSPTSSVARITCRTRRSTSPSSAPSATGSRASGTSR